ncbi:MAG: BatD family protein, partial [Bacteroidia bacterium]|nr:BatD family protein [Bacteroidia bacterium]
MRISLFLLVYFLFLGTSSGQGVRFYAKSDASKILQNSYVTVEFVLENGEGRSFKAPNFDGFTIISGPSRSSSFSSVNGAISKSMSFGYTLRPGKSGKLVIDRAQIISGNQRLYSDPIIIEVVQGSEKEISEQEEIFVQATLSDSLAYV